MSEERKVKKSYWIPALVLLFLFSFGGVFYFLSGPSIDEVSVPKVEGMTQEEAVKKLESLGLKVEISQSLDSKAELGKVIKQTPVENAKVKKGRTITLVVGGNSEKIKVPSLLGLSIKEAENALTKSNLALGNVVKGLDSTKPAGVILAQDTRAGDLVNKKSLIHVTINQEGSISMPDLRGKDQGDAVNILRNLGLDVTISEQSNSNQKNNSVISQTPDPATVMVNGGKVQLTVATTGKKQVSFSYEVQDEKEEIRFLKQTANGEQELFSKSVKKGEKIEKSFEIQRDEKVSFMVNGKLVSEK
jgi:serine/threonine-protein kinase